MIKTRSVTTGKFEKNSISEDAAVARKNLIAVSDGAGGGGLFADRWSKYLLQYLPDTPFTTADELDEWIGSIWEKFYNRSEESAKRIGGLALDKFYDEGSFATLAAVWETGDDTCRWMTYGDSVVFHYNYASLTGEKRAISITIPSFAGGSSCFFWLFPPQRFYSPKPTDIGTFGKVSAMCGFAAKKPH